MLNNRKDLILGETEINFALGEGDTSVSVYSQMIFNNFLKTKIEIAVFYSKELPKLAQKDIIICYAIKKSKLNQKILQAILQIYNILFIYIRNGDTFNYGSYIEFGKTKPLGFAGMAFINAELFNFLSKNNKGKILGFFLEAEELITISEFGASRIASFLGKTNKFYPVPVWNTIKRDRLLTREINQTSILNNIQSLTLYNSSIFYAKYRVILELSEEDRINLKYAISQLEKISAFYIKLQLSPKADGCLVWVPNEPSPEAIIPHNSHTENINGVFLMIIPQQEYSNIITAEDGFVFTLSHQDYNKFLGALEHCQDIDIILNNEINVFKIIFIGE